MSAHKIVECPKCHKTGARQKLPDGPLVCPYCNYAEDTATLRTLIERWRDEVETIVREEDVMYNISGLKMLEKFDEILGYR